MFFQNRRIRPTPRPIKLHHHRTRIGNADLVNALLDMMAGSYLKDVRVRAAYVLAKIRPTKS